MTDPQYICNERELAIRHAIYIFFQQMRAAGSVEQCMEQDWRGNILHVKGAFRPAELAHQIYNATNNIEAFAYREALREAAEPIVLREKELWKEYEKYSNSDVEVAARFSLAAGELSKQAKRILALFVEGK